MASYTIREARTGKTIRCSNAFDAAMIHQVLEADAVAAEDIAIIEVEASNRQAMAWFNRYRKELAA